TTCYRDWSSDVCSSDLTLFANGRTPFAAAPVPHTDRKPALYPANAVLVCQPSLRQCSASALFACVLSVILTEERSLQFQLRQDSGRVEEANVATGVDAERLQRLAIVDAAKKVVPPADFFADCEVQRQHEVGDFYVVDRV